MFAITGCHVAVRGTYVTHLHLHQNTTTMSVFNVTVIQVHQNTTTMSVFNVTVIQVHQNTTTMSVFNVTSYKCTRTQLQCQCSMSPSYKCKGILVSQQFNLVNYHFHLLFGAIIVYCLEYD